MQPVSEGVPEITEDVVRRDFAQGALLTVCVGVEEGFGDVVHFCTQERKNRAIRGGSGT
jgi:hypothetical protein